MMFKSRMDIIRYLAFMKNLAFFIKNDLFKKDTEGKIGVLFYKDKAYCITNHMLAVTESPGAKLTRPIFWSYNEANLIEGQVKHCTSSAVLPDSWLNQSSVFAFLLVP